MTALRALTVGGFRLFWLLKAGVDVVLEKCLEYQLILSKPPVFNYAQNEATKQTLLSVLLLKWPRFVCVHVCVYKHLAFILVPILQYFFIIRTEKIGKLIWDEPDSTTLSVYSLTFIFFSSFPFSQQPTVFHKVVPTTSQFLQSNIHFTISLLQTFHVQYPFRSASLLTDIILSYWF